LRNDGVLPNKQDYPLVWVVAQLIALGNHSMQVASASSESMGAIDCATTNVEDIRFLSLISIIASEILYYLSWHSCMGYSHHQQMYE
jgi:hypothetical protein